MFGIVFDKAKGVREHGMSNPRAPQRRIPLTRAFEFIPDRFAHTFPTRVARGDYLPVMGEVQALPDGTAGGIPIPPPVRLMAPLANSAMLPMPTTIFQRARNHAERRIQAERFLSKERISLLQLSKPAARDAATSLKWKPGTVDKPAPPSPYTGGFTRIFERNISSPKDTTVTMQPMETLESRWPKQMPLANFSAQSSAVMARFPKTL